MDHGKSSKSKSDEEEPVLIFIGEYLSPSEIHIQYLPTFSDAIHFARKQSHIKEHQLGYRYVSLINEKSICFYYGDGLEKRKGWIYLQNDKLQIIMEEPFLTFTTYFLIQKGNKLLFLLNPPQRGRVHPSTKPR